MANEKYIAEVSHTTDRGMSNSDIVGGILTLGLIPLVTGATGEVRSHTVTLRDQDGNTATGTAETYEQAAANARDALRK